MTSQVNGITERFCPTCNRKLIDDNYCFGCDKKWNCKVCLGEWKKQPKDTDESEMKTLQLCTHHKSKWRSAHCRGTA